MISAFRAFAKSPYAVALIALLIVCFALFGIRDVFVRMGTSYVVHAGGHTLDPAQFAREFKAEKEQAEKRIGKPVPVEMAVEHGFDRQLLNQMAGRESMAELVHRLGVRITDSQVAQELAKIPAFFDDISGKFDQQLYLSKLGEKGLTDREYEGLVRDEQSMQQVLTAAAAGFKAPRAYAALGGAYALESRDISFFIVDPRDVAPPKKPTDAELKAFIEDHKAALTRPEMRTFTVVRFSTKDQESKVMLDEAEVRKRFEERKASMSTPETRTLVQISAKDEAGARKVCQMLVGGATPEAAAKAVDAEPIRYEDKPVQAVVDRKVGEAAFKLKDGEVSQPIEGELGFAIVKVEKVTPGHTPTFAEVRSDIEEAMRKDAALSKSYEQSQDYDDAHAAGANLIEAAKKAGVETTTYGPVSAEGQRLHADKLDLPEAMLKTAFDTPEGGDSEIMELERGESYALRVDKVIPAAVPPLDEIREPLTQRYMMSKFVEGMQAHADKLAELAKKDGLAAAARKAGARVNTVEGVSRANAQKYQALGGDILGKAIGGDKGDIFVGQNQQFGFAVVSVDAVHPAKAADIVPLLDKQSDQISGDLFGSVQQAMIEYAKKKVKVKTDLDLARKAIGVDPATLPDAGAGEDAAKTETEK